MDPCRAGGRICSYVPAPEILPVPVTREHRARHSLRASWSCAVSISLVPMPRHFVGHAAMWCTPPRHATRRRSRAPRRAVLAAVLAALLGGGTTTMAQARTTHPYRRGPAPTVATITADRGPFSIAAANIDGDNTFGSATVYYPTTT